jgi:hypothetical protein
MSEKLHPEHNDEMVKRLGRVGAFAPGSYISRCVACQVMFEGDKRALNCLPCAVSAILARQTGEQDQGSSGGLGRPGSGSRDEADVGATAALAITDEMVRSAALILCPNPMLFVGEVTDWADEQGVSEARQAYSDQARAVLSAALGATASTTPDTGSAK